jgi:PAS domain S-box-containing protein
MMERLLNGIYMPHGYCLLWEPWLVTLHAASDILIFGAYSAIPLAIWIFVTKRPNIEMKGLARLFAAFILWCGLTHLFNVITLWHPIYEVQGLVKATTAAVSVYTAVLIFPLIPKALAIPSPNELQIANAQLEREVAAHKRTLGELREARLELEQRVEARTKALSEATVRFRSLFEHAPVAMLMIDRTGKVRQMNAAAEEVFAAPSGDVVGQAIEELVPESLRDMHPKLREADVGEPTSRPMGAARELFARRKNGEQFPVEIGLNPIPGSGDTAVIASVVDISHRRREEQRMQFVMRELDHRVKNALSTVSAVVSHTRQGSGSIADFVAALDGRIRSMATTHELLSSHRWHGVSLMELVRRELAPYATRKNIEINGPGILLKPAAGLAMAMVLHELATNAAKYGALATGDGRVSIRWDQRLNGQAPSPLVLEWQEMGGPPVVASGKPSYGTNTITDLIPYEFGGTVDLVMAPDGVCCRLELPAGWLGKGGVSLSQEL